MSAGSTALGFEVISVPVSAWCQNMDLSFLEKNLWTSVPTAWGGAMQGEEEGLEGGERKRMGWGCRKWQCVCSDKPVARPLYPGGGLGATRLQPRCSVGLVPDDPPQTTGSHLCCRQVNTPRKLAMTALYMCWILFKEWKCKKKKKEYTMKAKGCASKWQHYWFARTHSWSSDSFLWSLFCIL